jgi:glycosyltransferase involved in cell wall biosynthesis
LQQEIGIESPTIIPLGIDTQFFSPVKRRAQSLVQVLFAGRLIARKGLEQFVEAAAFFPRMQFRIVGSAYGKEDGAFARRIQQRVEADGLSNVTFMGSLSQKQLRQLMWESDILLHPSSVEGIPRVTLEAGATGMPSIVYDYYQTPSVVDGITGFQVKTFDEMMDRLRLLAEDRDLRWQMGEAAAEHVKQFDWGGLAKRWEVVFRELAAN